MAKIFRVFTIGVAATVIASLVGCSDASKPKAADSEAKPAVSASDAAAKGSSRTVENVTVEPGADPMAMVFQLRKTAETPAGSEQIKLNYPTPDSAVVVTTLTGMQDDAIRAVRTRYEFKPAPAGADGKKLWEVSQVTEQNKCQSGRGSQDWSGDLCK
jgi:hypothetical protein